MGRCSFCIKSQQAVDIHDIKCEAIFLPLVLILTLCMTRSLWFLNPVVKHPYFHIFIYWQIDIGFKKSARYFYSIVGFSKLCQANAKYCVTMVEEEKAAGGKAKENYVASPFSTTWAVSLSCEVLQHTFHPRRSRNIFNTKNLQSRLTDCTQLR